MSRNLFGRKVIYTDYEVVDRSNILAILTDALSIHQANREEIQYLYDYYKGKQPILGRKKDVRPEINNRIVENRANEIVSFKVGYLMGEPVQYVSRPSASQSEDENLLTSNYVSLLNEFVFAEDKACKDKELADWFSICGTAYRMILPNNSTEIALLEDEESPFKIFTLDPRDTFVIYSSALGNYPVCAVKYVNTTDRNVIYSVYTPTTYFEVLNAAEVVKEIPHSIGAIPIVEYPNNEARIGCFEIVLPLLDALNNIESNRMDGIEQFVQSLLMLKGCDFESDDEFQNMLKLGGISVPADGDVKYLVQELNQTQTQTLVDYVYQTILTICGMPSQSTGKSSDSSNNGAVILRNGWQSAEARAKDTELVFKKSEKVFLKIALHLLNVLKETSLKLSQIEIRFTRRNYENIQMKAQVLTQMLASDMISPKLAFEYCGMFADPELAYNESIDYWEKRKAEEQTELEQFATQQAEVQKAQINEDEPNED